MKDSRKNFIKQAHEAACSQWKKNIEDEFPKLFKQVGDTLIQQAKKRGFKEGVQFIDVVDGRLEVVNGDRYKYYPAIDSLTLNHDRIYKNGKWAEIIKEPIVKEEKANGWYKDKTSKNWCMFFENGIMKYGVDIIGKWKENLSHNYTLRVGDYKSTDKEVEEALIKEAKKIGFKEGVQFKSAWNQSSICDFKGMYFDIKNNSLSSGDCHNECIFQNGVWAEILETITKEQAEKELGKTIIN
ncbi:MAG: hypothetical protein ACJA2M_000279 [Polaribacter sp.]|jgi:hypothetical protein